MACLWAVEGIGSYGARLARAVADAGYDVAEAPQMNAQGCRAIGKSDPLDTAAAILGRAPSTISREVARNRVSDRYSPSLAHEQTWARARRPKPRKLDGLALREQVTTMLTDRFSPEQVAGRLKVEHPENPEMQVSHETIYQALYVQGRGSLRLEVAAALRSGRVSRRPQRPEGPRPQRFQEMVMISDRPAEVEDRAVPGHWEGDLIIGSTASKSAIGTLVERTSGYVMLLHLPGDHTARTVADAMRPQKSSPS